MKRLLTALLLLASPLWAQIEPPKPVERVSKSGTTITVKSNAEFVTAVATAQPGSTILLDSSVAFGPLTIPDGKVGLSFRPTGEAVTVNSGVPQPAMSVGLQCRDLSFERIAFKSTNTAVDKEVFTLVRVGYDAAGQREAKTVEELSERVEFLSCSFSGTATGNLRIGLLGNARHLYVEKCVFKDVHVKLVEAQSILLTNTSGPVAIVDSVLEGAGENFMSGGSRPTIPGCNVADLVFTGNTLVKPVAWKGQWKVKNIWEAKNLERAYIARNRFENCWTDAQQGTAILCTPRDGSRVGHLLFEDNLILNVGAGMHLAAGDDNQPGGPTTGPIVVRNNLFVNVGQFEGLGRVWNLSTPDSRMIELLELTGNRWTIQGSPLFGRSVIFCEGPATAKVAKVLNMTGNAGHHAAYGILGSGTASGKVSLDKWVESHNVTGNVFFGGGTVAQYPGNYFAP